MGHRFWLVAFAEVWAVGAPVGLAPVAIAYYASPNGDVSAWIALLGVAWALATVAVTSAVAANAAVRADDW